MVNAGGEDFEFTAALHSYFRVGDIGQVRQGSSHTPDVTVSPPFGTAATGALCEAAVCVGAPAPARIGGTRWSLKSPLLAAT